MSRTELIEIIYALQQENKQLSNKNEDLCRQLEERRITLENSGSIAEAALALNKVFEDAQRAADQYLLSVKENAGDNSSDESAPVGRHFGASEGGLR